MKNRVVNYKARQPRLDRFVALKILSPEKQNDPHFAERFEREARALASLTHPNIVMVYDFGQGLDLGADPDMYWLGWRTSYPTDTSIANVEALMNYPDPGP